MYIENFYVDKFKYADMVIYPISPTTAIPTTYPMLEPNEGEEVEEPALGENEGIDPLSAFHGVIICPRWYIFNYKCIR